MTGREENKMIIDNKIKDKIKDEPKVIKEYFAFLSNNGRDSAPTRKVFINAIIRFSDWLIGNGYNTYMIETWNKITPGVINTYLLEIGEGVKQKTKADYYVHLNVFFNFLHNMEYIKTNPFDGNKIPKQKYDYTDNVVYLTREEIEQTKINIRENEKEPLLYESIFTLGYMTGVRITALTEINIDDININDNSIRVTDKENFTRNVYIGKNAIALLLDYLEYRNTLPTDMSALFVTTNGDGEYIRVPYRKFRDMLLRNTAFTGKRITPHRLRDTCAMLTYEKSHDIYLTGEVLGHKNFENTRKYTRVTEERRRNVAEFLDEI